MKVLCFIDSLNSGGAQRQLVGLADFLNAHHHTKVLWYHPDGFYREYLENHHVEFENVRPKHRLAKLIDCRKAILDFSPDVVIAFLDGPACISCMLKVMGAKYRCIVSERNTTQKKDWRVRVKFWLYRWADAIVPNSSSQEKYIKKHYPRLLDKVKTITNFTDTTEFSPSIRLKCSDSPYKPTRILCVARIVEQKNILRFIRAIEIVAGKYPVLVDWYGNPFRQQYYELCLDEIKKYNLEEVFYIHKPVRNIVEKYQSSDIFCLPSLYEGYPNVICEAMSCGLPILCSNVCDNQSIVEDGRNGFLFNPESTDDMANKIMQYLLLPADQKTSMAIQSRNRAEANFSIESFTNKYLDLIRGIA